ncbi:adenylosuccinate synthetase [Rhizobium rhizogenes]|uniref:adenylosuccinate synthetase n=1 Tax=Rhizobium rhizogenes TaxID=359 RepID=UPI001574D8B2|nr:adenylosuccinate synthetase [Rhizobium rhizogenes]NTH19888.1 AAA family ATPase [Rhizobium rhizogenes]NTH32862.1 AAA family ATPase [Rhizobium rhizogenes]NTJ33013.1 AAA family ATPase [Rhizobium rhizogenes]
MQKIIILSGPIAVGKTAFADELMRRYPCQKVSTRNYILKVKHVENSRASLQEAGMQLDDETNGSWVSDAVAETLTETDKSVLLIDSARIAAQVERIRERFGRKKVLHIHLTAAEHVLKDRYEKRNKGGDSAISFEVARQNATESQVENLALIADVVVETDKSDVPSCVTFATATRVLPLIPKSKVDLFVGGQWGSEGKGNICALLASEYDILVRVGGPNAGHKVQDPKYTYRQLPSGTGSNPQAQIFIAAGSTISLKILLQEIEHHEWLKSGRLFIDGQAMIIEEEDVKIEQKLLDGISSTKQGVGSAAARKILGRDVKLDWGPAVRLARNVSELEPYIANIGSKIERALIEGKRVMLEGTQGTELSIHHGSYPHVTSRETSAAGCLSDAGVPFTALGRVVVVARTYPIRVGGKSGPMGVEVTMDEISHRSGLPIEEIRKTEIGSVSNNPRRMAEFDWERLRRSVYWNGATEIALTFVDYLGHQNSAANRFEELNAEAQHFIENLERVCGVPVSLISKGFGRRGLIDRRN